MVGRMHQWWVPIGNLLNLVRGYQGLNYVTMDDLLHLSYTYEGNKTKLQYASLDLKNLKEPMELSKQQVRHSKMYFIRALDSSLAEDGGWSTK